MFTEATLFRILDSAVKDISQKVAKIDVVNMPAGTKISAPHPCSIYTKTKGDYELTVVLCADSRVLEEMTRNMRRGAETNEDHVPIYMQEFLNILCGHVVSAVNQCEHLRAYFDIPSFIYGEYECPAETKAKCHNKYYYDSPYGALEVKTLYS